MTALPPQLDLFSDDRSATSSRAEIDLDAYVSALEAQPGTAASTSRATTSALLESLDRACAPHVGWVVNSSTGKDSSVLTAVVCEHLVRRQRLGLLLRRVLVIISDTGSEFPEMAVRMRQEAEAINDYGRRLALPLSCRIVRPPVKSRLLVEIIGNGKPLPDRKEAWCMDRVKGNPIAQALRIARDEFPAFVQMTGVRTQESATRAGKIENYSRGMPFGLTWLGDPEDPAKRRFGSIPIVHWSDREVTDWFKTSLAPWSLDSNDELRRIYGRASTDEEKAGECSIQITKEGEVTNACSDLSGARMGCWMCLLSANRSLKNTAAKDARYLWLKKFHNYLYRHHKRNSLRRAERIACGYTGDRLFPKNFTFRERYFLLMLLFRAELESGFPLIEAEEIELIGELWRKHGVWQIKPEAARADAADWKRTGDPTPSWARNAAGANRLMRLFGEGIPAGGAWIPSPTSGLVHGLDPVQLSALAGQVYASPLVPVLTTYVFRDTLVGDRVVMLVSDSPSVIGTKTRSGLLNGLSGASWRCAGVREPTDWEKRMSDGRSFFYVVNQQEEIARAETGMEKIQSLVQAKASARTPKERLRAAEALSRHMTVVNRIYENGLVFMGRTTLEEEPLALGWILGERLRELRGKVTWEEIESLSNDVWRLQTLSWDLNEKVGKALAPLRAAVKEAGTAIVEDTPAGKEVQAQLRRLGKKCLDARRFEGGIAEYFALASRISTAVAAGRANFTLVERLAELCTWRCIDPEEAAKLEEELRIMVGLQA